jgi:creatinine amidohydrolase/Fe(II)-dependent formamide hydrolase-like protein
MTELHQHRLDYMTWADARDYLTLGGDTAILPVGSTEMHGPHLPLGTDLLISLAVATLAAPNCNAVILPPLPYTWAGATRPFAGTISLPADLVLQFVKTICQRLIDQGFRHIALVSQHNPDTTTLGLAANQMFEETRVPVVAFNPYTTDPHMRAMLPDLIAELDRQEAGNLGFTETSFLLAALEILGLDHLARPEVAALPNVPRPAPLQRVRQRGIVGYFFTDASQHIPVPRNPSLPLGRQYLQSAAEQLVLLLRDVKDYRAFLDERPPTTDRRPQS